LGVVRLEDDRHLHSKCIQYRKKWLGYGNRNKKRNIMRVKTRIATLSQQVGNVSLSYIAWVILVLKFAIVSYFIYLVVNGYQQNQINFDSSFFFFIVVGFFAQIVDG